MNKDVAEVSKAYQVEAAEQSVPLGYKQTEVGVIPEDWDVQDIGKIAPLQRGFDLPASQRKAGNYPVVYSNGIVNTHSEFQAKGPGIVTGRSGTLGKVHYVEGEYWPHNTTLWVTKFNNVNPKFVYFLFYFIGFERFASGSGVPTLNRNDAHGFKVSVPRTIKEQTAIANALSDVDALLSELEKLIVKKQAIKTATMQQLLTGRTRLPQFALHQDGSPKGYKQSELGEIPEDWDVRDLSTACGSFKTGKLDANAMKPHGQYRFYTCAREHYYIDDYAFDTEALLVSGNGANVGYVHYYKGKFNAYERTYVLSDFSASVGYLKIYLEIKLADRIRVEVNAGNTPYITMDTLTDMPIVLPMNHEEQTAIATILSDMDEEIQSLEQRLNKTRQIKQGMMQELLTGKTRLV